MAHVADHLSVSALEQQYRSCTDVTAARHLQTIWLLAKGHEIAEVAATVSFARRWVERLLARYNAQGPQALGDLRRRNGGQSHYAPASAHPDCPAREAAGRAGMVSSRSSAPHPDPGACERAGALNPPDSQAAERPQNGFQVGSGVNFRYPRSPQAARQCRCGPEPQPSRRTSPP